MYGTLAGLSELVSIALSLKYHSPALTIRIYVLDLHLMYSSWGNPLPLVAISRF